MDRFQSKETIFNNLINRRVNGDECNSPKINLCLNDVLNKIKHMNSIIYFSRNEKAGFSIQKVFNAIIKNPNNVNNIVYEVPSFRANFKSLYENLKFVYQKRDKNKIHHITGDIHYCILALIGFKSVLTIHDLVLLKTTKNKFKKIIFFLFWYYLPIKLATKVVCISSKTKEEVVHYINRNDIEVITNPVAADFKSDFKDFNTEEPVILHIGTGWNKNLIKVIKALEGIKCHLRIIGEIKRVDLDLLESFKINFSNTYNISDSEIINEYIKADIISFPSLFEGFGMPILEGQAIGRVVLTSNISPMKEIGNDSAKLVNPESVESIKLGFLELINNKEYRESLISKGLDNVKKHSLEKVVTQYKNIYNQISR